MLVGGDKLDDAPSLSMDKLGTGALLELGAGGLAWDGMGAFAELGAGGLAWELGAGGWAWDALALDGPPLFAELGVLAELAGYP